MRVKTNNKLLKTIYYLASITLILAILCTLFYVFWFLRDPIRTVPEGNLILSPADGKVVRLFKTTDTESLDIDKGILGGIKTTASEISDSAYILVIMMTPFDVHYQRAPIEGTIRSVEYKEGSFLNIMDDARSLVAFNNEKNEIVMSGNRNGEEFDIKIIQVAGFLVRRIVDYVDVSQIVEKGEHIGLIKFGSMVVMIFPDTFDPMVSEGDYIYGAETVIAEY
ncbi:MAG: phosphatidylserine decarboxylase family protein [Candidatus Pacebacteria bacterium]|nr:phosphatidylserine decarboxylase family protein [Candidatus Paceibacterota bacterium]